MLQMPPTVQKAMIAQFTFERFSADVYYALSTALDTINLVGFGSYMSKQAAEEREHAHKFASFLADRDVRPVVEAMPAPVVPTWASALDAGGACFLAALEHEYKVTEQIHALYDLAEEMDDKPTCEFLLWFIHEQVEEVKTLDEWMTRFTLASGNGAAILDLDQELRA